MNIQPTNVTSSLLAALLAVGCADGTDFGDPEHVRNWANSASALAVYAVAYEPIGFADGEVAFTDPTCPATSDDGTSVEITGGCTDSTGKRWVGFATVVRGPDGARDLMLDEFGSATADNEPAPATGTLSIRRTASDTHTFEADYTIDGLTETTVQGYLGTVVGDYEGATTWAGSGIVSRGGLAVGAGTASASTVAQLRDPDVCTSEAASGTTTIELGDDTLTVEYDGATDCDEDATARYSVNGEDRGTVDGIHCAASPGRDGSAWAVVAALGALALAWRRRRAPRRA